MRDDLDLDQRILLSKEETVQSLRQENLKGMREK